MLSGRPDKPVGVFNCPTNIQIEETEYVCVKREVCIQAATSAVLPSRRTTGISVNWSLLLFWRKRKRTAVNHLPMNPSASNLAATSPDSPLRWCDMTYDLATDLPLYNSTDIIKDQKGIQMLQNPRTDPAKCSRLQPTYLIFSPTTN